MFRNPKKKNWKEVKMQLKITIVKIYKREAHKSINGPKKIRISRNRNKKSLEIWKSAKNFKSLKLPTKIQNGEGKI